MDSDRQALKLITKVQPTDIQSKQPHNFWLVFSSTFITIFLAEMGDKTQLVQPEIVSPYLTFNEFQ